MFFENYHVFLYIILFVVIYNVAKRVSKNIWVRNSVIFIGNLLMILSLVKEHTFIVLTILSLIVFLIGKYLQKRSSKPLFIAGIILVITLFTIRNYTFVQGLLTDSFLDFLNAPILSVQKLGLSYILFRYVHWIIESNKRTIERSNFLVFLNYILFFPSILAGPIDTYANFHYWVGNSNWKYQQSLFFAGITRIFLGAFKTLGIVPLIIVTATDYTVLLNDFTPLIAVLLSLVAYSFYIYFDFSGYSDIAIGTAYLVGIKTPENFNAPYLSTDLSDFWKRWHITFSNFLKLYVFKPFIILYNALFGTTNRLLVSISCYITTFMICGLWHGDKINFVYWGLWHGVGLSINKIWTVKFKKQFKFSSTKSYLFLSGILTFIFVTIGWMFFHYTHEQLVTIFTLVL